VNEGASITLPGEGGLTFSGKTFKGWNTAATGSGTDYAAGASFTVNGNTNFYAQWRSEPVVPPGSTLAEKFAYIAGRADDGAVYEIPINTDELLGPTTLSTLGRNVTINLYSADPGNIKSIQLTSAGALFTVNTNITLQLSNITLKGISANTNALVEAYQGGILIVNSGTKITLDRSDAGYTKGRGVYLEAAVMVMNGGEITENYTHAGEGGGIAVYKGSTLTIKDGIIAKNGTYDWYGGGPGGGIGINGEGSTVIMNGGLIYENNSGFEGGGVNVGSGSSFTKRPAEESTTSGIIYGSSGDRANSAKRDGGAAVYRNSGNKKRVARTLGVYDHITSLSEEGWE
jgi:hypothetical protein